MDLDESCLSSSGLAMSLWLLISCGVEYVLTNPLLVASAPSVSMVLLELEGSPDVVLSLDCILSISLPVPEMLLHWLPDMLLRLLRELVMDFSGDRMGCGTSANGRC
jgi:hypothetical protein